MQLDAGHEIVAYTAGKMKKNRIKTLAGDRVTIEMSPYDLEKGRLIFRHKDERPSSRCTARCTAARRPVPPPVERPATAAKSRTTRPYRARCGLPLAGQIKKSRTSGLFWTAAIA